MTKRILVAFALAISSTGIATSTAHATTERTSRLIIANSTTSRLSLTSVRNDIAADSWRETPTDLLAYGSGDFTELVYGANKDVGATLDYAVVGTDYTAEIDAEFAPFNQVDGSCRWFKDGRATSTGPYHCELVQRGGGDFNDVNFSVKISPK